MKDTAGCLRPSYSLLVLSLFPRPPPPAVHRGLRVVAPLLVSRGSERRQSEKFRDVPAPFNFFPQSFSSTRREVTGCALVIYSSFKYRDAGRLDVAWDPPDT